MSQTITTLVGAITVNNTSINVASATGFAAGSFVRIDQEMMLIGKSYVSGTLIPVIRGVNGTAGASHATTANVVVGLASDFDNPEQGGSTVTYQTQRARTTTSYTTAGAITLPNAGTDVTAILNSTTLLAMTLAAPAKDNDGDVVTILGNGKAAHTVTIAAGLGDAGAGYTVMTFDTLGQCSMRLMAANLIWVPWPSPLSGTLTAVDVAVA